MAHEGFAEFYVHQYNSVLSLAFALTGDSGTAEDVTHDAFLAAYEEWEHLANPAHWIRRVVANRVRSFWRRRYAETKALSRSADRETHSNLPEDTESFWREVRELTHRQAQVITLFYLEDLPVSEIAQILACSESTARVHLHRARKRLADRLREYS